MMGRCTLCLAVAVLLAAPGLLRAQPSKGPPNALQGFSQNRDKPVRIEAATLEVRDRDKAATFSGDVRVTQGDTVMRCKSLVVFYEQETVPQSRADANGAAMRTDAIGPVGEQKIKRLEARGNVIVTQKDQTVTGDLGIFDMKSNTVTLTGNPVVMTQGKNVLRGGKLVVNLDTGVARVESGKGERVQSLILPNGATPDKQSMPAPLVPFH